jgi:hypothetical protein
LTIGIYTFDLHLPMARSLKDRRQVVRRVRDRLRARHNVAVAETEEASDRWQRAGFVVVSVATHRDALERLFEAVHREATSLVPGELIETGREYIDATPEGPHAWLADGEDAR